MKKIAIMQPYFLPYIGYFQLINSVDEFVLYDNIQFTKRGWIHRNRILENGKDVYISLPVKKDSDYLNVDQRVISEAFHEQKQKLLNKIRNSYSKAPYFKQVYPIVQDIVQFEDVNLFSFIHHSVKKICNYLEVSTPIVVSSELDIDHGLKGANKVKAIVNSRAAKIYINSIGGMDLYDKDDFFSEGIDLKFLKTDSFSYRQFNNEFIPFLSIIDTMMFISLEKMKELLNKYTFE